MEDRTKKWRVVVTKKQLYVAPQSLIDDVYNALINKDVSVYTDPLNHTRVFSGEGDPPHALMELAYLDRRDDCIMPTQLKYSGRI